MPQIGRNRERRRHTRSPVAKMVAILWEDENGRESNLQGRLIDVSVSGAKIWLPIKLPARAAVSFNCPTLALGGRGTVRYCNSTKDGFEVGLEIGNGTGWREQNTDLQNLAAAIGQTEQVAQRPDVPEAVPGAAPNTQQRPRPGPFRHLPCTVFGVSGRCLF
jgi:PilZ domain